MQHAHNDCKCVDVIEMGEDAFNQFWFMGIKPICPFPDMTNKRDLWEVGFKKEQYRRMTLEKK